MFSFEYFSDKLTFFTVNIYWQSGIELFWQDKFVMFDNLHGLIEANLQDLELATKEKVWLFILKFCILLINGATFQSKLLIHLYWQQIKRSTEKCQKQVVLWPRDMYKRRQAFWKGKTCIHLVGEIILYKQQSCDYLFDRKLTDLRFFQILNYGIGTVNTRKLKTWKL